MDRSRIRELHYITDIANVSSILDHGILSHRLVKRRIAAHVTVASVEVQAIRAVKRIWVGHSSRALHNYANLYVHARNAMLFQLVMSHERDLTVLAVDPRVLDVEGVIVADRNAAATIAKFDPAAEGVEQFDEGTVFATWWNDSEDAKQRRMAEVLVPDRVPPDLVLHAYVPNSAAARRPLGQLGGRKLPIRVNRSLFFVDRSRQ